MILYYIILYIYGWWLQPSEKYEFVSWDDDIPNIWKNKIHVPNHQPDIYIYPLVICYIAMEAMAHRNRCFVMIYLLKMVILHSYVKQPEGIYNTC